MRAAHRHPEPRWLPRQDGRRAPSATGRVPAAARRAVPAVLGRGGCGRRPRARALGSDGQQRKWRVSSSTLPGGLCPAGAPRLPARAWGRRICPREVGLSAQRCPRRSPGHTARPHGGLWFISGRNETARAASVFSVTGGGGHTWPPAVIPCSWGEGWKERVGASLQARVDAAFLPGQATGALGTPVTRDEAGVRGGIL